MMGGRKRGVVAALAVALVVGQSAPVFAEVEGYANDAGTGFAAVGINLLYIPAKVVYATLGGLTGGFAYILTGGRMDTASSIWKPALGGTYVVTPAHVRREEPVMFSGAMEPEPVQQAARSEDERYERRDDQYGERARDEQRSRRPPSADGY
jgi:hypothetical protein